MAELNIKPRNQVRFAFWSGEEDGLIGSEFYVDATARTPGCASSRSEPELRHDRLAQLWQVHLRRRWFEVQRPGQTDPTSSRGLRAVFRQPGLGHRPTAFDGRSDYGAFIARGIPAGGLFTGAEDIKSAARGVLFGASQGAV